MMGIFTKNRRADEVMASFLDRDGIIFFHPVFLISTARKLRPERVLQNGRSHRSRLDSR